MICQQVLIDKVQPDYSMAREAGTRGIRREVRRGFQKEVFSIEY